MTDLALLDVERAALERLHRARCIVSTVAHTLSDHADAQGALEAAADLIMQVMATADRPAGLHRSPCDGDGIESGESR